MDVAGDGSDFSEEEFFEMDGAGDDSGLSEEEEEFFDVSSIPARLTFLPSCARNSRGYFPYDLDINILTETFHYRCLRYRSSVSQDGGTTQEIQKRKATWMLM